MFISEDWTDKMCRNVSTKPSVKSA